MILAAPNQLRITVPRVAGLLCAAMGFAVLAGWALEISWIKRVLPGAVDMKANTALGVLVAGATLCLLDGRPAVWRARIGQVLALFVAVLGLATFSQFAFGWSLGIDELLFEDPGEFFTAIPGRMSPYSATVFAFLGLGLAALPVRSMRWLVLLAGTVALIIGGVAFIGYLWVANELVTDVFTAPVAIHTAAAFIFLGIGTVLATRAPDVPVPGKLPKLSPVERKTLGAFAVTVVLLLAAGGLSYRSAVRETDSAALVTHTLEVRARLGSLYAAVSDAESQNRNYLLSGNRDYLEAFRSCVRKAGTDLGILEPLVADNPTQTRKLDELRVAVEGRMAELESTAAVFGQSGIEAAQKRIRDGEGLSLIAAIRSAIAGMDAAEAELLKAREADVTRGKLVTLISLLVTLAVALTGFLILFRGIQREMRTRAQAEEELERFFKLSLDFLCISSADGYFKRVSPVVTDILGWSTETFLATPFIEMVHPDDRAATLREVERQVVAGEKVLRFDNRYRHKDGSWRVLSWRSVPQEGGLMYATARDVTEERMRQDEVRRLNADLERQAAQLEVTNKELEAFSYSVSHDLRAPLRHVQGYVEMLTRDSQESLSEKSRRYLRTIFEASRDMGQLIDDLLSFSKMGRAEMREGVVDLNELIDEVRGELTLATRDRDIRWTIAHLQSVRGDHAMLKQVLANLLGNAVKYTRRRGTAEIEVGCACADGGKLEFFVRDNGAGFDMRYADKLFGVFQRLHCADEFEGTGIGLANVRRIVARHGGTTRAEGRVDQGATFYFSLTAAAPEPVPQTH